MAKPSIHYSLMLSIAAIVALPLLLAFAYFLNDSYSAGVDRAQFSVQKELDSQASGLKNQLYPLQYQIADFAKHKAVTEMPVNILLAQFTYKELQELVEDNQAIDAAFISDGSQFVIEGYPARTYKIDASAVAPLAQRLMQDAANINLPVLTTLSDQLLFGQNKIGSTSHLFFMVPLKMEQPSLIDPFRVTGVLFVQLNSLELAPYWLTKVAISALLLVMNSYMQLKALAKATGCKRKSK